MVPAVLEDVLAGARVIAAALPDEKGDRASQLIDAWVSGTTLASATDGQPAVSSLDFMDREHRQALIALLAAFPG